MRYFWLSKVLLLLFAGCAPSPYQFLRPSKHSEACLEKFLPGGGPILYKTNISIKGHDLSGLLIYKKMEDKFRVLFTNEVGITFFDFEFGPDDFRVNYCMEKLNRKPVIRQLRKDLGLLIFHEMNFSKATVYEGNNELFFEFNTGKERNFYVTNAGCTDLIRIENASNKKKKAIVNLSGYKSGMPDSVEIVHQNFDFNIYLKQIER